MKTGTDIQRLAGRIMGQVARRRDFALDTRNLLMLPQGNVSFDLKGELQVFAPTNHCRAQMADRVGIPRKYAERLQTEAPSLLAMNINHWWSEKPETRMLRTLEGTTDEKAVARAFLSHRYRPLDNADLVNSIVPQMVEAGCEIRSCELTERHLYLQAVTPKVQGEVKVGDVVQAGVTVSNSEVGAGSIRVEPLIFRLACLNGMILPTAMRRHHVGRGDDGNWDGDEALEVFSDQTRQLNDKAFWAKVNDVVTDVLKPGRFQGYVQQLRQATKIDTGKPTDAVEILAERYRLTEGESESVLEHLSRGGDLSLWGLANAVTRTANDVESYDRAVDLERIGGEVIELPKSVFN